MADSINTTLSKPLKWQHTQTLAPLITLRLFTACTLLVVSLVAFLLSLVFAALGGLLGITISRTVEELRR